MKTCPLCKSACFDDMDTCYVCMHRFDEDAPEVEFEIEEDSEWDDLDDYEANVTASPAIAALRQRCAAAKRETVKPAAAVAEPVMEPAVSAPVVAFGPAIEALAIERGLVSRGEAATRSQGCIRIEIPLDLLQAAAVRTA